MIAAESCEFRKPCETSWQPGVFLEIAETAVIINAEGDILPAEKFVARIVPGFKIASAKGVSHLAFLLKAIEKSNY